MGRRVRSWATLIVAAVLTLLAGLAPAATTTASAETFIYDAQSNARVDAQAFGRAKANPTPLSEVRERTAPRSASPGAPSTTLVTPVVATNTATIESGNYVVSTPRGEYVGQSGNISNRLDQHVASGKFTQAEVAAAQRISVPGSKLDREIAEQLLIDSKGGVPNLVNVVNPIGPKRFGVMPNQPYVR